jgi:predicted XRE-type DNA-binding protein
MEALTSHWTEQSADDFLYKIAADFALQIENYLEESGGNQTTLAERLKVTPARVSQVLNNPGNMTLRLIVEYARKLGKKVAIVAYDDNDPANTKGPINSQVFERCWRRTGKPDDLFGVEDADALMTYVIRPSINLPVNASIISKANMATNKYEFGATAGTDAKVTTINKPAGATTNG